ncbi:MAG: nucleoside phosphorylase [Deltaproteobacteria bacterium]|jgi:purine-nucleoside phosphorylase|nr:nucleoside phosphorylase [Deltaproteobacteria bacterium]
MPKTKNSLWEPPFPFPRDAEDLPSKGILAATPALVNSLKKNAPEPLDRLATFFMLGGTTVYCGRDYFLAGPVLGSPMAVMALEVLMGGGAETVIFTGFAGSLVPELKLGDIFLPDRALSTEGTSAHYSPDLTPDAELYESLQRKALRKGIFHPGTIWTTDGPFRETKVLREASMKSGAKAVEMEVSALYSAAKFRGIKLASIILITDIFSGEEWTEGFKSQAYKDGLNTLCSLAWEAVS